MHHLAGALAHGRGEQQLAARRQLHALDRLGQRSLVGDRERPELLDLVAEELDAHGVVGRGREHVEDAAAHRELAAAARPCRPGRRRGRRGSTAMPGEVVARAAPATSSIGSSSARLSASGCSAARTEATMTSGCREPAAAQSCMRRRACMRRPDGLGRRAEPLVRQRLPRGELEDLGVVEVRRDGRPHRLALAARRGDDEERRRQARPRRGAASRPASSGASMPAGAEKSAFRRASASAPSIVEARESAVFKPCRITRRVYARPPTRGRAALRGRTASRATARRGGRHGVGGARYDGRRTRPTRKDTVIMPPPTVRPSETPAPRAGRGTSTTTTGRPAVGRTPRTTRPS